jgi:hypothetical protein
VVRDLIAVADKLMYDAKRGGRDRVHARCACDDGAGGRRLIVNRR